MEGEVGRYIFQGMEFMLRIGQGSGKILIFLAAAIKKHKVYMGEIPLKRLLRTGESYMVGSIPKERMDEFVSHVKEYGILYATAENPEQNMTDVIFRSGDLAKYNQIVKRMNLVEADKPLSEFAVEGIRKSTLEKLEHNSELLEEAQAAAVDCVIIQLHTEQIRETIGAINRSDGEALTPDDWRAYLEMQAVLYDYSARNKEKIYEQYREATMVMSKTRWHEIGRNVAEDAHGITIMRPAKTESGKTHFIETTVYDVQDTNGKAVGFGKYFDRLTQDELSEANKRFKHKYPTELKDDLENDALFSPEEKKIFLKRGLTPEQEFQALQREAIYGRCFKEQGTKYVRETNRFRADSVTYALSVKYGLDAGRIDFSYLEEYSKEDAQQLFREKGKILKDISGKKTELKDLLPARNEMEAIEL